MAVERKRRLGGAARVLGAVALLAVGGTHIEQYTVAHYSIIPTIGELFLVNFIAATACGIALLAPVRRQRLRTIIDALAAVGGIGVSAGALAALLISEHTPLFGFSEHAYRLEIVIALASEAVAIVALAVLLTTHAHPRSRRHLRRGVPHSAGAQGASEA
jgi:hypothetical protein